MTGAKFDIEKFDGTGDFGLWRIKMRALLIQRGCNKVLREVTGETTAAGVWSKLETLYMIKSLANKLYLKKKLYTGRKISEHIDEFNKIVLDLANIEAQALLDLIMDSGWALVWKRKSLELMGSVSGGIITEFTELEAVSRENQSGQTIKKTEGQINKGTARAENESGKCVPLGLSRVVVEGFACEGRYKWKLPMEEEMDSLRKNKTWELVADPSCWQKCVSSKWLFKIERDCSCQKLVRHTSIRVILALTACKDYELEQLDVKMTFLHENFEEVIYMEARPQGYDTQATRARLRIGSTKSLLKKKFDMKELGEAKNILSLVYGTDRGNHVDVTGFVDSDYAKDPDKGRSITGYAFLVQGCVVSWKATLQHVVALSTIEAEYMALTEAVKEAIWLRGLLEELGVELNTVAVNCDNQGAIHLSRNHVFHDVRYHFIREVLEAKTVKVLKVGTEHNAADALTKVVPGLIPSPAPPIIVEVEAIRSVLQGSKKVYEKLQKQEDELLVEQEVTQKAKNLMIKSLKSAGLTYIALFKPNLTACYKENTKDPLKMQDVGREMKVSSQEQNTRPIKALTVYPRNTLATLAPQVSLNLRNVSNWLVLTIGKPKTLGIQFSKPLIYGLFSNCTVVQIVLMVFGLRLFKTYDGGSAFSRAHDFREQSLTGQLDSWERSLWLILWVMGLMSLVLIVLTTGTYYVDRTGHNLFYVGQFFGIQIWGCFQKAFLLCCDTDGVDITYKGSDGLEIYTLSLLKT
ncbi:hypothetical protein Tco_1335392 [Tanacetum coccineum]